MRVGTRIAATVLGALLIGAALAGAARGLATHRLYAITTGSMSPTIPPRSLVVIDTGHYELGQPITFMHKGGLITHRFVGTNTDGTLVTKGDANRSADPYDVQPADVLGGVIASPAQLGYWLVYLKNPLGMGSLAVSLLLLYQVWVLFREPDDEVGRHMSPANA